MSFAYDIVQRMECGNKGRRRTARSLAAIASLPIKDIVTGFEELIQNVDVPQELDPVVEYLQINYVGNIGRGPRRRHVIVSPLPTVLSVLDLQKLKSLAWIP